MFIRTEVWPADTGTPPPPHPDVQGVPFGAVTTSETPRILPTFRFARAAHSAARAAASFIAAARADLTAALGSLTESETPFIRESLPIAWVTAAITVPTLFRWRIRTVTSVSAVYPVTYRGQQPPSWVTLMEVVWMSPSWTPCWCRVSRRRPISLAAVFTASAAELRDGATPNVM